MAPLLEERRFGSVSHRQASPRTGRPSRALPNTGQLPGLPLETGTAHHAFPASRTKHSSSHSGAPDSGKSFSLATPDVQELEHVHKRKLKYSETHLSPRASRLHGGIGQRAATQAFSLTKDQDASASAVTALSSAWTVS